MVKSEVTLPVELGAHSIYLSTGVGCPRVGELSAWRVLCCVAKRSRSATYAWNKRQRFYVKTVHERIACFNFFQLGCSANLHGVRHNVWPITIHVELRCSAYGSWNSGWPQLKSPPITVVFRKRREVDRKKTSASTQKRGKRRYRSLAAWVRVVKWSGCIFRTFIFWPICWGAATLLVPRDI